MINLRNIIAGLYPDKTETELVQLLETNGLFAPLRKTEIQLNEIIAQQTELQQQMGCLPMGAIVANLLVAVNTRLRQLDAAGREELEPVLSDVCKQLMAAAFDLLQSNSQSTVHLLAHAIEKTCEFHDYDKHQLLRLLNLQETLSHALMRQSGTTVRLLPKKIPALTWQKPGMENPLPEIFADHRLMEKPKSITKLFNTPPVPLELYFNAAKADQILYLFKILKQAKLISHTGCSGIYLALSFHVQDFEKNFLKNKTARARNNELANSRAKLADLQDTMCKWLKPYPGLAALLPALPSCR